MKKTKLKIGILMFVLAMNMTIKASFLTKEENQNFETVHSLPTSKKEVREGATSYTVKVLESKEITQDYFVFDKDIIVKKDFYTYPTTKFENANLQNWEEENSILFKNNVYFKKGSAINIRTNVEKNLGDFINFENISVEGNELFVEVADESKVPRFLKIPLFVVPGDETTNIIKVKMLKPLIIGEAQYTIRWEYAEQGKILYFMEPLYKNEETAQKYALLEQNYQKESRGEKTLPETVLIREKITIFKENGSNLIYTSNIVDLFIK